MYRPTPPSPYKKCPPFPGGDNFRSPMPPPRFQSSPRYFSPSGSGQCTNPRFAGAGNGSVYTHTTPQSQNRSPGHRSPRGEFDPSYPMPCNYGGSSPYQDRGGTGSDSPCYPGPSNNYYNQGQGGARHSGNGRGRYKSGNRDFQSARGNDYDSNPGGNGDIRKYYSPKMIQDPWSNMTPRPATNIHSSC